jgi:hypothetical protein
MSLMAFYHGKRLVATVALTTALIAPVVNISQDPLPAITATAAAGHLR